MYFWDDIIGHTFAFCAFGVGLFVAIRQVARDMEALQSHDESQNYRP